MHVRGYGCACAFAAGFAGGLEWGRFWRRQDILALLLGRFTKRNDKNFGLCYHITFHFPRDPPPQLVLMLRYPCRFSGWGHLFTFGRVIQHLLSELFGDYCRSQSRYRTPSRVLSRLPIKDIGKIARSIHGTCFTVLIPKATPNRGLAKMCHNCVFGLAVSRCRE